MEPARRVDASRGRSGWAVIATLLAIVALAAAGLALWTAWEMRQTGVDRAELDRLHSEVESLRVQVQQMNQPLFGPTGPPAPGTSPAPQTGGVP